MATTKTAKVQAEIEKARAKLAEQQARLKDLEHKKTEIENTEIVDIVRGMSIPLDELAALLQSIRAGGTMGQNVPKLDTKEDSE
jgi:phage terminase Nu1 subunit (DNA packaging protein)